MDKNTLNHKPETAENAAPAANTAPSASAEENQFGANLNFAVREAYKRLRTNVIYSLPKKEDNSGLIIGVTSAMKGEGKSSTSLNLAYTLAEAGSQVAVVEADLRLPGISSQLKIKPVPGLSDYLVSPGSQTISIRRAPINSNLFVVPAGTLPPNPSELLGSQQMSALLRALAGKFDYVIVDLPPIGAVTDALIIAKQTDGMLLVVRQNYAHKRALNEAIQQLNIAKAKILGFVMNDVGSGSKHYGKKKYGYYQEYSK